MMPATRSGESAIRGLAEKTILAADCTDYADGPNVRGIGVIGGENVRAIRVIRAIRGYNHQRDPANAVTRCSTFGEFIVNSAALLFRDE